MNGNIPIKEELNAPSFKELFKKQIEFQKMITKEEKLPKDDIELFNYHMLALMEEIGELRHSDKRWKSHRNTHYDLINKIEEISDCFITLMNVAIFSGMDSELLLESVQYKMKENTKRLKGEFDDFNS